jgi:hypothetical protein
LGESFACGALFVLFLHNFQHQNTLFFVKKYNVYLIYPAPFQALYCSPTTERNVKISISKKVLWLDYYEVWDLILESLQMKMDLSIRERLRFNTGYESSFLLKEAAMKCYRCGGIMVYEKFYGICEFFWGWRCIFCGEIVDQVILENRPSIGRNVKIDS